MIFKPLRLGAFDFADLDICLRLVDRSEGGANQVAKLNALMTSVPGA